MLRKVAIALAVVALSFALVAGAQVDRKLPLQGRLTSPAGAAYDGTFTLTFGIWNQPSGGAQLWNETHPGVSVSNGFFQVVLGSVTPLNIPFDSNYWLEVTVSGAAGTVTLSPRQQLLASPYSLSLGGIVTTSGGNVGIGLTTPQARLDVAGTVQMTGFRLTTGAASGYVLTSDAAGVGTWQAPPAAAGVTWPLGATIDGTPTAPAYSWSADNDTGIRRGGADNLRFVTAGADRVTIDAAGYVGIGTASPTQRLHVEGNANITGNLFTGTVRMTGFQLGTSATPGHVLTADAAGVGTWQALPAAAGVTWPLHATIDGTPTAPAYSWSADNDTGIRRGGADNLRFVTAGADRVTVDAAGNVGIGTASPGAKLSVDGIIQAIPRPTATCDASTEGGIFYSSTDKHFYGCNGTGWIKLDTTYS